jgi:DHA2 family multidrug resistance protein
MNEPLIGLRLVLLTFSLSLGIFMNVLDVSIANVAIPTIAGNLAVSANQGTWLITSFAVSQAIMLPITGWLARRFGEVRLFVLSTFLFSLTSVLCGLSENLSMLIFFRVLQGAVSGPMIPLSQSILLGNYPDSKKGLATGIWTMTAVVAPIFGPILGGWITDNYTWPWIFYINLPVGMISVLLTWSILSKRESVIVKTPIDYVGLGLLIMGIGALQIMLDKGNDLDWFNSGTIVALAIVAFISICYLIVWELTEKHPVIDLTLFANRNFTMGTIALTLGYMVYFFNIVILPLWLQTTMGYTATWAGLAAAPVGILPFFLNPLVGIYMNKFDLRIIITIGFLVFSATSFWQSNFYTQISYLQIIEPRFIQGIGIAFFFAPLISIVISGLPAERIAGALGLANFCRILGGSFGTSMSVTAWYRREDFHQSRLVENISDFNPVSNVAVQQVNDLGFHGLNGLELIMRQITQQAFMMSTDDLFWISGWVFLSLIALIWFAKPPFVVKGRVLAE